MNNIDKVSEKFALLMIEKIKSLSENDNFEKPWFGVPKINFNPCNIEGNLYHGGNAFMLFFLSHFLSYQTPIFLTFNQCRTLGVKINKGSESFPVYYYNFSVSHKETKKKIKIEDYKKMSQSEQENYIVKPFLKYYNVFNLDQTNYCEVFEKEFEELQKKYISENRVINTNFVVNPQIDDLMDNWLCPVYFREVEKAYFKPGEKHIVLPKKQNFKSAERFYSVALHEMAHSTQIELKRTNDELNEKNAYAREELVAELTSAFVLYQMGVSCAPQKDNAIYLKSWLKSFDNDTKCIMNIIADVVKAAELINSYDLANVSLC